MKRRPHPLLLGSLIALMVASWSLNFVFGKIGLRHLRPLALASFRVVLAGAAMLPIYLLFRPRGSADELSGRPRGGLNRRDLGTFVVLGFFGVVVNQICFTVGLNYTTVGHSALIIGMGPIFILLLARLKGLEALTAKKVLGMAVAFAGITVLAAEHGLSLRSATLRGDLITLTGTLGFALYTVLGKRVAAEYDSISMNAFNYFVGAVLVLPVAGREAALLWAEGGWRRVGWEGWLAVAYMAIFASVVAYLIYFWVLRYMAASRLGAFGYLHPVVSTLLGVALLGEALTGPLVLGGVLVLAGVYTIESGPRENQRESKLSG